MKYSTAAIQLANIELYRRRKQAEVDADKRKEDFIKEHPEYAEIEAKLSQTGSDAVFAAMSGSDSAKLLNSLKKTNLDFQKARKAFLKSNGLDENYLEPQYTCKKCNDTGALENGICPCYEELLKKYAFNELSEKTPLQLSGFEDFDVNLYSDASARQKMAKILAYCKSYAQDFDLDSDSLFIYGETGIGKTHLSLAIANEAIKKGYGVVYGSAHSFFSMIERERFGRSENPDGTTEQKLLNCDLLILDDLGSEFTTQLTVAELYSIIDERMAKDLPTIINSNLSLNELEKQYNNRITSRIIGTYKILNFVGNDIRQVKK